ncbi:putative Alpha/beta-Hydrolases superfamily protein [Capsicum annuum]|nr:putative Alpha/beta-Hydrolases superfamily protein [Capsicum annuum]
MRRSSNECSTGAGDIDGPGNESPRMFCVSVSELEKLTGLGGSDKAARGKAGKNVEVKIRSGHLVQGVVKSINRMHNVVYLSSDPDAVSKCVTKDLKGLSIDLLVPGMMVNASVRSILDNGIMLSFLTYFTGTADMFNLQQSFPSSNWKVDYPQNKKSDSSSRVARLSVLAIFLFSQCEETMRNGWFASSSVLSCISASVWKFNLTPALVTNDYGLRYHFQFLAYVNARILFIDPSTRAVGLTLNPHLVHNKAPPAEKSLLILCMNLAKLIKVGDIFDQSKVIRIDRGLGLLLEIPSSPVPTPTYVNVSDVADKEVIKLEKSFKEGKLVRVRVLGFRHLEGLATGVLKTSAFEGSVFTHSDVKPGMVVKGKVIAVDSFGAIVQFSSGVKALCPLRHMSEFEIVKPRKKFQVGAELVFRILGCKSKRITITHKKTLSLVKLAGGGVWLERAIEEEVKRVVECWAGDELRAAQVKSKLEIVGSYADATEGLTTHGWITKIENHGCFVRFYNGVQGFAPRAACMFDNFFQIRALRYVYVIGDVNFLIDREL